MKPPSPDHDLRELAEGLRAFAKARDWEKYHTPKNLAIALSVEASELLEPFQWLTPEEADALSQDHGKLAAVADELADVAIYLVRLADVLDVDLGEAIRRKMEVNESRFPPGGSGHDP
jgi:NTP pyrophosphatase (non-canonical NTP hydrolase)